MPRENGTPPIRPGLENVTWFSSSPDVGTPECICSYCGKQIPEEDAPILRVFRGEGEVTEEARFCSDCDPVFYAMGL